MLLSYYGDDFTGSTDVMEALARAGVPTVLFVDPPGPERMRRYPEARAVGIAGHSRSMTPAQMEDHLPPIFRSLRALGAPLVHYKVCSTFDSSPEVGSIGRAIDLAAPLFGSAPVPLVVGAPVLGRYCVFGNLFARSGLDSEPYRLDRHPTMRRHPITPMDEADLTVHLGRQTEKGIGLFDVLHLEGSAEEAARHWEGLVRDGCGIVLLDTLHEHHLPRIGHLIWRSASAERPVFAVGSSGVEYALVAHWAEQGLLGERPAMNGAGAVDRLLVVSGSCAPVTDRQIARALGDGFGEVALDAGALAAGAPAAIDAASERAARTLAEGRSVIVHSSRGPDDPRIEAARAAGATADVSRRVGEALGEVLDRVVRRAGLRRVAVTGGDTSGLVARRLGIEALEMIGPMAPGSPLCRAHAADAAIDGLEITFKGGQVGRPDFFAAVLRGHPELLRSERGTK